MISTVPDVKEPAEETVVETEPSWLRLKRGMLIRRNRWNLSLYDRGGEITLPSSYMVGDVEKDLAILLRG